jgi:hypothetical protein
MKEVNRYYKVTKLKNDSSVFVTDHGFSYMVVDSSEKNNSHTLSNIMEWYPDDQFITADGFDDAVIGIDENTLKLIYSQQKVKQILMERDGMSDDEAHEFYQYNIQSAYVGEGTPIWCSDEY